MKSNIKALPTTGLKEQLAGVFYGLKVSAHIKREVSAIARQVAGGDVLEPGDTAQLRDLVLCCQRIDEGTRLASETDDPALWGRLVGKCQTDTSLKRALLKDLKASKAARTAGTKETRKPDGGSDWKGVL